MLLHFSLPVQIKNTVSSAQCVAMDLETPLSMEHIKIVLSVVSSWHTAKQKLAQPALTWEGYQDLESGETVQLVRSIVQAEGAEAGEQSRKRPRAE